MNPISKFKINQEWTKYTNLMNEGGEGYNPHQKMIEKTAAEIARELSLRGLSKEQFLRKRGEWNQAMQSGKYGKKMGSKEIDQACKDIGISCLADLKLAKETYIGGHK